MSAAAGQFAQLAYRLGRHGAGSEQTLLQIGGDALAILLIGLSARQRFDVLRVHQNESETPLTCFQYVPDRLPVNACRFHGDMPNLALSEPSSHLLQVLCEGPEYSSLS